MSSSVKEVNFHSNKIMASSYDKMNIMRKQQTLCDLCVRIGSKILPVHKIVLAANSDYFDKMFTGGFKESNVKEITLNEIDPNAVEHLINYIYTSELKITEDNVQNILLASNFLLIDEVDIECIKFMRANIKVENCLMYKHFAYSNNVAELDDCCLSFILNHFTEISNSSDFLLQSFEFIFELIQNNQLNISEEKLYESIILWAKHELKSRIQYLPDLMESLNMSLIPVSYFMTNIEKEEILKSNCNHVLYDALKMYTINFNSGMYSNQRANGNQLILITSWKKNRNNLEWMKIGNKTITATHFTWTTFNSIILSDGRIFRITYCSDDNNWYGSIYNDNQWNFIGNFRFNQGSKEMLRLVELFECIYVMSHYGYFKCYNMIKKTWEDLERINVYGDNLRGLTIYDGSIYCINAVSVSRFNTVTKSWSMISKDRVLQKVVYSTICSLDGCLYELGGMRPDGAYLKSAMKFNLSSQTWSEIAEMNIARKNSGVVAVNGLIYVFGGEKCNTFEIYDPISDKWTLSENKLGSNHHIITRAFLLNPELNITPDQFSKYYPEYIPDLS